MIRCSLLKKNARITRKRNEIQHPSVVMDPQAFWYSRPCPTWFSLSKAVDWRKFPHGLSPRADRQGCAVKTEWLVSRDNAVWMQLSTTALLITIVLHWGASGAGGSVQGVVVRSLPTRRGHLWAPEALLETDWLCKFTFCTVFCTCIPYFNDVYQNKEAMYSLEGSYLFFL